MGRDGDASLKHPHWPRLLVVGSFLPGFGLERYAGGALAVEIMRRGGKVITTSHIRSRPLRLADMLWTAYQRRADYDLVHTTVFSGLAFVYAEWVSALMAFLGKPNTIGLHGGNLPCFARRQPERTRRLFRQAAVVVCPSRYLFEEMKLFRNDMHLIPNAIDITKYPARSGRLAEARLLWLRAFHQIYNPEMAPALLARVLGSVPNASLTMVGPDKGDGSLEATKKVAKDLGVLQRITFLGPVPKEDVPKIIAQHEVFINTANVDNTPVSLIEAMACGLPVVSTNVGGIPYLVEHGKTAMLVKPGDTVGMAAALIRLFGEPVLAARLSQNGRKLAESFDWSVVLPQWHRCLAEVASGNGSPVARPAS